jgi:hypothetical protein
MKFVIFVGLTMICVSVTWLTWWAFCGHDNATREPTRWDPPV